MNYSRQKSEKIWFLRQDPGWLYLILPRIQSILEKGQTKILGPASVIWDQISEILSQKGQPGNPRPPRKVGLDHEIALNNNYFFRVLKPFAVYVFYEVMRSVRSTSTLQSPCLDIFERCLNFRFSNYAGCAICHVATLKGVQSYWTYGQWRTSAFWL